jgi:uncharacterized membrane protein
MLSGQLALVTAAVFTGAAIYVNVAEHPARMMLDDASLLVQWKPAYKRGALMQASLAVVGFLLGLLAWHQSGQWPWLAGAFFIAAPWPWTIFVMLPLNNTLMALDPARYGVEARPLLEKWSRLHAVRTALGCLATLLYLLASLR